jgi:hypothetical protein
MARSHQTESRIIAEAWHLPFQLVTTPDIVGIKEGYQFAF